jgi:hypothetical protein
VKRRFLFTALSALTLPAAAVAQTATSCLPQEEAAALVTFALPTLVERLDQRCAPLLPSNAYLATYADTIADRYRSDAASAWPVARRALEKVFGQLLGQSMPPDLDSDMVRQLAGPMIASLLAEKVKTEDCAVASLALESLANLNGRDTGRLIALGAAIADRKGNGIAGTLRVCKPGIRP